MLLRHCESAATAAAAAAAAESPPAVAATAAMAAAAVAAAAEGSDRPAPVLLVVPEPNCDPELGMMATRPAGARMM